MLIDWFTVIAQIINFMILVWLLNRFLYRPILKAIGVREKRIANQVASAEAARQTAEEMRDLYHQKNDDFDRQRVERMQEMEEKIALEQKSLMEDAKEKTAAYIVQQQERLQKEAVDLERSFRKHLGDTVMTISRKILLDLSGESLEDRIAEIFAERLSSLDSDVIEQLADLSKTEKPIIVSSCHPLTPERQQQLQVIIQNRSSGQVPVIFQADPNLSCGLEISRGSYVISWNLSNYLHTLQKQLDSLITHTDSIAEDR